MSESTRNNDIKNTATFQEMIIIILSLLLGIYNNCVIVIQTTDKTFNAANSNLTQNLRF